MRHSPNQLISGRDSARTKVPHASSRGRRRSKEDGSHLLDGVLQPCAQAVTHPPRIGMFLRSPRSVKCLDLAVEQAWFSKRPHDAAWGSARKSQSRPVVPPRLPRLRRRLAALKRCISSSVVLIFLSSWLIFAFFGASSRRSLSSTLPTESLFISAIVTSSALP